MERQLWVRIFALPLLALAVLASHGNETSLLSSVAPQSSTGPGPTMAPGTSAVGLESGSSLNESARLNVSNNNNTESGPGSSLNSTTEEAPTPVVPPKASNETTVTNSSETLGVNVTITVDAASNTTLENQTSTAPSELNTTSTSPSSKTDNSSAHVGNTSTPQPDVPVHNDNTSTTTKPVVSTHTPVATATAAVTTAAASTTATSHTTASTTTMTTTTTQGSTQALETKEKTPTTVQSGPVSHKAITQSLQNVGEQMVHEGPTLDPLLAGLVSAFIIAAVIITLLLFLKLRRRDSRPEFRRLQDLPMDDMMEDTPLSMYSY